MNRRSWDAQSSLGAGQRDHSLCLLVTYLKDLYVAFVSSVFPCAISSSSAIAVSSTGPSSVVEAIVVVVDYYGSFDIDVAVGSEGTMIEVSGTAG